ncbi:hypothetical protein HanIR_Chr13g0620701 [Helianthus annuus]|nr:hypothetical protein HanIR_Chr13g0620701 [Helianthus annuus]
MLMVMLTAVDVVVDGGLGPPELMTVPWFNRLTHFKILVSSCVGQLRLIWVQRIRSNLVQKSATSGLIREFGSSWVSVRSKQSTKVNTGQLSG